MKYKQKHKASQAVIRSGRKKKVVVDCKEKQWSSSTTSVEHTNTVGNELERTHPNQECKFAITAKDNTWQVRNSEESKDDTFPMSLRDRPVGHYLLFYCCDCMQGRKVGISPSKRVLSSIIWNSLIYVVALLSE
eukprot:g62055.t1